MAILLLSMLVPIVAKAYVGKWQSYTKVTAISDMLAYQGALFVATSGGIRKINPENLGEEVFLNTDGLIDVQIVSLVADQEDRLWAASRSGLLFRWEKNHWSTWGKAYKAERWQINPRTMLSAGDHLIFGSVKGISFFDRNKGVAQVNLTKFGKSIIANITGIARLGDTLYVANGTEVLQANVDFKNIFSSKYGSIYDPLIWKPAVNIVDPKAMGFSATLTVEKPKNELGDSTAISDSGSGDTVTPDLTLSRPFHLTALDGQMVAHDSGFLANAPLKIKAILGRPLEIEGHVFPAVKRTEVAVVLADRIFLGAKEGLSVYSRSKEAISTISPAREYPLDTLSNIAASSKGVFAVTGGSNVGFGSVVKLVDPNWYPSFTFGASPEILSNELRILSITPEGNPLMGNWGQGVLDVSEGKAKQYIAGPGSCMRATVGDIFTAVNSMSDLSDGDLWLTILKVPKTDPPSHWLAHLNVKTGKVSCPEISGEGFLTHSTRILSDSLFGVAGDRGVFLYDWQKGNENFPTKLMGRVGNSFASELGRDLALDRFGRLWIILNDRIGFVDSLKFKMSKSLPLVTVFPENINGKACRVMETDARMDLWIGCDNGLFHVQPTTQAEVPMVEHFTTEDGLVADRIFDISVIQETGMIWLVTENGISAYESSGMPVRSNLEAVRAFPNPFLKKHSLLVLDGVPAGGTATLSTQSGNVVRQFAARELKGSQFQWDGKNSFGQAVKPGIYFYSINAGGKSSRGKIIVAR